MNLDKEILIEKYFQKQLSEEEQIFFEESMKNDEAFKTAFDFEKNVRNGIHFLERDSLKNMLRGFEEKPQKRIIPLRNWVWMSAAAMLIIGLFFWLSPQNPTSQELYLSYYQSYPNIVAPVVRGENNQDEKYRAFAAYEQEKYQLASTLFHQIFNKTKDEYALFYESQSYFALGETQKGIEILKKATFMNKKYPFKTQQQWYLALGYLKLGDSEKAKIYLQLLTNYENTQQENAEKLLKSLH